ARAACRAGLRHGCSRRSSSSCPPSRRPPKWSDVGSSAKAPAMPAEARAIARAGPHERPGRFDTRIRRARYPPPVRRLARRRTCGSTLRGASCVRVAPRSGRCTAPGSQREREMKLAVKLSIALVLGIVVVMAIYAWVQISNEVVLSEADAHRAQRNGLAWLGAIESVWAREGEARARELIDLSARRVGAREGAVRIISLAPDAPDRPHLSGEEVRTLEAGGIVRRVIRDADGQDWIHAWADIRTAAHPTGLAVVEPLGHEQTFIRVSHLAAGVAHELGTPLNVITARAELLVAGTATAADAAANGRTILEQADRMTAIIHQLLDFSRRRGPNLGLANVEQLVARTLELVSPTAQRAKVRIERVATGQVFARFDQSQIQQVLANVFMNAIQAMPGGGRLIIAVGARRAHRPGESSG